jgi:hypothetical protein
MFMTRSLSAFTVGKRKRRALLVVLAICAIGCGPELTTPGSTNVSGTWTAPGPAAGLTDVSISLNQASDGSITGTYTATGRLPTQFCPTVGQPCQISGTLSGTNSVLEVYFELKDAGQFSGQVFSGSKLKGSMARLNQIGQLEFTRVVNTTATGL